MPRRFYHSSPTTVPSARLMPSPSALARLGGPADDGGADGPRPLAWFSFAPLGSASLASSTKRGELQCTLRAPRALRSLVLVLVSAEDRMFFMHDEHADPNIDLEFCGLSGHVLSDDSVL